MTQNSKDKFNNNPKMNKKTKISGTGNSIILPAGSVMQGVPHLKQQLNNKHISVSHHHNNSMHPININHSLSTQQNLNQSHQRMQSLQDSNSVGANMARGFNSASNAAM